MNERDRIEYLMNLYGLTPSQFSDKTGIQRASVSHILSNRNKPSLEILLKIYNTFHEVELAWLVAGEGNPPVLNNNDADIQEDVNVTPVANPVQPANMLFSFMDEDVKQGDDANRHVAKVNVQQHKPEPVAAGELANSVVEKCNSGSEADNAATDRASALSFDVGSAKRIKEIKVFYSNGTYETFLPEK